MTWRMEWWKSLPQNVEKKKNEDTLIDLQSNIKHTNIHIIVVPEGEERKDLKKYINR